MHEKPIVLRILRFTFLFAGCVLFVFGLAGPLLRTKSIEWDYRPQGSCVPTRGTVHIGHGFTSVILEWVSLEPPAGSRVSKRTALFSWHDVPYRAPDGSVYRMRVLMIRKVNTLLCVIGIVLSLWPTARLMNDLKYRRRRTLGLCEHCGYDLTGNLSGACPECGCPLRARGTQADRGIRGDECHIDNGPARRR